MDEDSSNSLKKIKRHIDQINSILQYSLVSFDEPATEKQIKFMQDLNIPIPQGCTKKQAYEIIKSRMGD